MALSELAALYQKSNKTFIWTLVLGFFCLHFLWIWSFIEFGRMKDIKIQVASMGVDVWWWQSKYNTG